MTIYLPGGQSIELYKLPNGQWQFGKGRDAVVITDMTQVDEIPQVEGKPAIDPQTREDIHKWVEKIKHQPTPAAVQQGQTPLLAGISARDQLSRAISVMPEEVVNRLLLAVTNTLGPLADSINQESPINHHSDGYGQDQGMHQPATQPFTLPEDSRWVDPSNPASGYLSPMYREGGAVVTDKQGKPITQWHPTPEFHQVTDRPEPIPIAETTPLNVHQPKDVEEEMEQARRSSGSARELVGAGRRTGRRR